MFSTFIFQVPEVHFYVMLKHLGFINVSWLCKRGPLPSLENMRFLTKYGACFDIVAGAARYVAEWVRPMVASVGRNGPPVGHHGRPVGQNGCPCGPEWQPGGP